jgi:hypothetical protein
MLELVDEGRAGSYARHRCPPPTVPRIGRGIGMSTGGDRTERGCTFRLGGKARPNMNADNIIANDAHRAALLLSATTFTQWGIANPADPVGDLAAVRELRV